jgi:hypothetical protein
VDSLQPAREATAKFQERNLTAGSFFGEWQVMIDRTRQVDSSLAVNLVKCFEARQASIIKDPAFLASVYMDLRYQRLLSSEMKATAVDHLVKLWKRQVMLRELSQPPVSPTRSGRGAARSPEPVTGVNEPDPDPLEDLLRKRDAEHAGDQVILSSEATLRADLVRLETQMRLPSTADLFAFWSRHPSPELRELAEVACALPVTQVSVERTFSGLRYVLNDMRMNLSDDVIDAIMVLRSNT